MNGISLLVALAAVGVDVGFESTDGKLVYTIRIESVLVDQLRNGSAIQTAVEPSNRGLRRFRVAMGPKSADKPRSSSGVANEVDYGWRPNQDGGIDYYVQMPADRLETLSQGFPIDCQVHPDVTQIDKIYVFVGAAQLPREPAPAARSNSEPQYLSGAGGGTRSSGGVAPASGQDTGISAPAFNTDPQFRSDNAGTRTTLSDNNRSTSPQNTTRNDQNRWASEPRRDNNSSSVYGGQPSEYNSNAATRPDDYNRFRDETLPVPNRSLDARLPEREQPSYGRYSEPRYEPRPETVARQPANPPPQPAQQPSYAQPAPQVPVAQQPAQPTTYQPANNPWPQQPPPGYNYAALQPSFVQPHQPSKSDSDSNQAESEVRPWTPLILTTLALFASIGANGYLGWLAWSFFWRFRDAASDLARARTAATTFPTSSIVGR